MHLSNYNLSYNAFQQGVIGYCNLLETGEVETSTPLTIIDFSLPSSERRFFTIDLKEKRLLFYTHVAHGRNSGLVEATKFSNTVNSLQSSLGFYKTAETYTGQHGYSLMLDGLEPGYNSNARKRAIVIHPANYVSRSFLRQHGRMGRSWGCPALSPEVSKEIIDTIKDGSCLFIYAPDENYSTTSSLLNIYAALSVFLEQFA